MPVLTKMSFAGQEIVMSLNTSASISALSGTGSSGVFVESLNNKEYFDKSLNIVSYQKNNINILFKF